MSDQLTLNVVWSMLDKITKPLKAIQTNSSATSKALKETRDRLKDLNAQQKSVAEFRGLSAKLKEDSTRLKETQQRVKELAQGLKATENPTRSMTREFDRAVNKARAIKEATQQQARQLQQLRDRLSSAGISTRNLATHEATLRNNIAATNAQLATQMQRLSAVTRQQERLTQARARMDKTRSTAAHMAGAGIGATASGLAVATPVKTSLFEASHYATEKQRIRGLGMTNEENAAAFKFTKDLKTYGTSQLDNLELMRDAMTVFADEHHAELVLPMLAKMKFANKALYGEEKGGDNDRKFMDMLKVIELRGGTNSQEAFNAQANTVQKILTATGGRVGPNEWLNVIKTGGIAAKGMNDDAFYNIMEPLVQEMGGFRVGTAMMSAYQNLYQGRTSKRAARKLEEMGLIGDPSKVQHDKAGQLTFLNPGALKGAELFRDNQFEWMRTVLLPQLASRGITKEKDVLDAMGSIFSNRTASNLFGQMFLQQQMIAKSAGLNRKAADIDTINTLAMGTADGKQLEARARLRDLELEMGDHVLPIYTSALETLTGALKTVRDFMAEHATLAKVLIVSLGVLAGILLITGPLMLAIASVIGPYAILRFLLTSIGIKGGVLLPILRLLAGGFRVVGMALLWLGRLALANPIGLLVTAIAGVAFLIYKYWEPIKGFFKSVWADVHEAFSGGITGITALLINWSPLGVLYSALASTLAWFGIDLPKKFTEFGGNILRGLVSGITGSLGWVRQAITGVADSTIGWFKEKLGIRSPSRVFTTLGDFTMQGLARGIDNGQDEALQRMSTVTKRLTQIGAGIAIGATAMPALSYDTRPPLSGNNGARQIIVQGDTIEINLHAQPGMDEKALMRMLNLELDRRDREKAARLRSSLFDYDN